jgi:hypothetical protein
LQQNIADKLNTARKYIMKLTEQNEVLEITQKLYSLGDIQLMNAIENINHLHEVYKNLKNAEKDKKIVFSGHDVVQ